MPAHPLPRLLPAAITTLATLAAVGLGACADGAKSTECALDTDCPNGGLCVANVCEPDPCPTCLDGGNVPVGGDPDDGVPAPTCVLDGKVERKEITLGAGVGVPFRTTGIEEMIAVDLAGTPDDQGKTAWDLSHVAAATDTFTMLWPAAEAPSAAGFPDADYLVALPGSPGLVAFFDFDAEDEALRMLGLADVSGAFTNLVYDPPVDVLQFPLEVGKVWETRTTARGTLLGAQIQVTDHYRTEVRAAGNVTLPAGQIPALQLVTTQERAFDTAGFSQASTTVDFLAECGGFVAKAVSAEGERGLPTSVRMLSVMLPQACESDATCGAHGVCRDQRCALGGAFADYATPDPVCRPDGDGAIADEELPVRAGLSGVFRLNDAGADVAVDLAGEPDPAGGQLWRFDADALGTTEHLESALDPEDFWFTPYFTAPEPTYVSILDAGTGTYAVFARTPGELSLLGLASKVPDQTLLVFDTPVPAMKFPLRLGDHWTAETRADGRLSGQQMAIDMRYEMSVDAEGHILLPAGTVPVLRLRMVSTQQVVGAPTGIAQQTVLFVAECLGAVARVLPGLNVTAPDFTSAVEVARMTVPRCLSSLQCGEGAHCVDGRCEGGVEPPPPEPDGGVVDTDGGVIDTDGSAPDTDGGVTPPDPDGGEVPLCNPQGDYTVERAEFPLSAGQTAHFRIADSEAGLPIDLHGTDCAEGKCWDLSAARDGDESAVVELMAIDGLWFAPDFPDASYVSYVDREQGWLGVFRLTDDALQLLGTASTTESEMKTTYDPPVDLYRFPLHVGDEWEVETTQLGYMNYGWMQIYTNDTYHMTAAAKGELTTPQGTFRVVQVIAQVSQAVPFTFLGNDSIVHTFISECFGIVGRVVSESGETEPYFERASRIERLAPAQ